MRNHAQVLHLRRSSVLLELENLVVYLLLVHLHLSQLLLQLVLLFESLDAELLRQYLTQSLVLAGHVHGLLFGRRHILGSLRRLERRVRHAWLKIATRVSCDVSRVERDLLVDSRRVPIRLRSRRATVTTSATFHSGQHSNGFGDTERIGVAQVKWPVALILDDGRWPARFSFLPTQQ